MRRRCIEVGCEKDGTHRGKTRDGYTIYVCEEHKDKWREAIRRAENVWYKRLWRWLKSRFAKLFKIPSFSVSCSY